MTVAVLIKSIAYLDAMRPVAYLMDLGPVHTKPIERVVPVIRPGKA